MSVMRFMTTAAVVLLAASSAGCTSTPAFRQDLGSFIDQLRGGAHAPPGFVVVAVHRDKTVFERAYGVRDVASGIPMSLDTPIYNASVTKAYTGVLAAVLDASGQLPLSTSLRDVWPTLTLPAGLDPAAITASRLLSHSSEVRAGGLIYRSVTTGEVSARDVPEHLQRFATRTEPGFAYSNLGPFVYSAMVETRTGVPWREAIAREVFEPMGLHKTSARIEDVASDMAHCHYWQDGGWHGARPKPTLTLNAAGGIYSSGRDTGRFLRAFISDHDSGINSATLRRTWQPIAEQDRDLLGMHRDGYGLGWDLGTYDGHRFVSRSGGYTGCRALILFLPIEQFGVAVLSVGDTGVNTFNSAIVRQAIDYWVGAHPQQRAAERLREYEQAAAAEFARLPQQDARAQAAVEPEFVRAMLGTFANERLGGLVLAQESGGLVLRAGIWIADLAYQGDGEFIATERGTNSMTSLKVVRDASGGVAAVVLDDDRFDRAAR